MLFCVNQVINKFSAIYKVGNVGIFVFLLTLKITRIYLSVTSKIIHSIIQMEICSKLIQLVTTSNLFPFENNSSTVH